jgi:murein DD-endopeptidase MepM/ murein hydrolase activator NlpD
MGALYALNIAPGRVKTQGDSAGAVMYSSPSKEYQSNAPLDIDRSGSITIGDFDAFMARLQKEPLYQAAKAKLDAATGPSGTTSTSTSTGMSTGARVAVALTGLTLLGAVGVMAYNDRREHPRRRGRENPKPVLTDKQILIGGGALLGVATIGALLFAAKGKAAGGSSTSHGGVLPQSDAPIRSFPVDKSKGGVHYWDDFGQPRSGGRTHQGNDIFGPEGALVFAPNDGTVSYGTDPLGGPYFSLKTQDGKYRYYGAHVSAFLDAQGEAFATTQPPPPRQVKAGDAIARVGHTGNAAGTPPHLHFQLWINGATVDPFQYLKAAEAIV